MLQNAQSSKHLQLWKLGKATHIATYKIKINLIEFQFNKLYMCTLFPDDIWIHETAVAPSTVSQPRPPSAIKGCWMPNTRADTSKKIYVRQGTTSTIFFELALYFPECWGIMMGTQLSQISASQGVKDT